MELDRSSVAVYATNLMLSLVGFVGTAIFAQTLGAAVLGIYFTFDALTSVLEVGARMGVDTGVEKRMSESDVDDRGAYLVAGYVITAVPVVVISLFLFLFREPVEAYVGTPVLLILIALLAASTGRWLLSSALRAQGFVARNAGIELIGEVVRVGASVLLIYQNFGVYALLYGILVGIVVKIVLIAASLSVKLVVPTRRVIADLWNFSKYTFLTSVSTLAYNWMDTLVLAFFLTKDVVGVYEASWKVSVVAVMASQALGTAVFPAISNWQSKGERAKIENAISEGLTYGLVLIIPAVVGTALLAEPFMELVYAFETGALVLLLLMSEKLVQGPRIIVEKTLTAIGKPELVFRVSAVTLIGNIALNVALVPTYGMYGAALSTIATVAIALGLEVLYLRRFLDLRVPWRNLAWQTGAAGVMGAVVYLGTLAVPPTSVPTLGILVALGVATYGLLIAVNTEMRARLLSIL